MQDSPWGAIQQETIIARDVSQVYTASHGGMKISKNLAEKYPLLMDVIKNSRYSFELWINCRRFAQKICHSH